MKLSELKSILQKLPTIKFTLPDGSLVPEHFHVTEVGKVSKHFIDCGGTERKEEVVNFQLWSADDYNHRLHPEKLAHIIELSEKRLGIGDLTIEVEYQGATIGKYALDYFNDSFQLTSKHTDCLARENCAIPQTKEQLDLSNMIVGNSCDPNSGCC